MSYYVTLYVSKNVYNEILDAIIDAVHTKDNYYEISDLVHLLDHLEDLYQEDAGKQNKDFLRWQKYEELFDAKESLHPEYFSKIDDILDEYADNPLSTIEIDERDRFHLIHQIIDVFIKDDD